MINPVSASNRSTANGVTTVFAYTFQIDAKTEISVWVDTSPKTVDVDFSVDGLGNSGGGNITFFSPPANGTIVTRLRAQLSQQLSNYVPGEALPSERLESDLDKVAKKFQEIDEKLGRRPTFNVNYNVNSTIIDAPTEGLFARAKVGGGVDWATPTNASPAALPISITNGGTGSTTAAAARTALGTDSNNNLIDAIGDLLAGTADNTLGRLATGTEGDILIVNKQNATGLQWRQLFPDSLAPNPFFEVDQLANSATSIADDNYGHDHWYALTQTGNIQISTQTDQEDGTPFNVRLTQQQAAAQRFGYACILEHSVSVGTRNMPLVLRPRIRISSSQPVRCAVLEWTNTKNAVTSDIVSDWTSSDYTTGPGKFFVNTGFTVLGTSSITPTANVWTNITQLTVTPVNVNNLVLFVWTEGTLIQNGTVDISRARLVPWPYFGEIRKPTFNEVMVYANRFFLKSFQYATAPAQNTAQAEGAHFTGQPVGASTAFGAGSSRFPVRMLTTPTIVTYNPNAANAEMRNITTGADCSAIATVAGESAVEFRATSAAGSAAGNRNYIHWTASARL